MRDFLDSSHDVAHILSKNNAQVHQSGIIPTENFDALKDAGLFSTDFVLGSPYTIASVIENMFASCVSTALVWAQHIRIAQGIATSANMAAIDKYKPSLDAGTLHGGISYRGLHTSEVTYTKVDNNYYVTGMLPFVTGIGLIDILGVYARNSADINETSLFVLSQEEIAQLNITTLDLNAAFASKTMQVQFSRLPLNHTHSIHQFPYPLGTTHPPSTHFFLGIPAVGIARKILTYVDNYYSDNPFNAQFAQIKQQFYDNAQILSGISDARYKILQLITTMSNFIQFSHIDCLRQSSMATQLVHEATFACHFSVPAYMKTRLMEHQCGYAAEIVR